jgi:hypothetical protein
MNTFIYVLAGIGVFTLLCITILLILSVTRHTIIKTAYVYIKIKPLKSMLREDK